MIIIGISVYSFLVYRNWSDYSEGFDYFINGIFGFLVGGSIGLLLAFLLPSKTETITYESKIVCLQDGGSSSGSFFLGCGSIKGEMQYVYYSDNGDSTYSLNQIGYRMAKIRYTTGTPRLLTSKKELTEDWYNKFSIPLHYFREYRVFEVPRGSIQNNYNLDAQ